MPSRAYAGGPMRQELEKRQIQPPANLPRMPPGSAQMTSRQFSADRDTNATPRAEYGRQKGGFTRILRSVPRVQLAAIEPQDAETGSKALLGMRSMRKDSNDQRFGVRADGPRPAPEAVW